MPTCQQCGFENPEEAKFCGKCGAALGEAAAPATAGSHQGAPFPPVSPGLFIGIIVGTVFVPVLGIVLGVIFLMDPNPDRKKAGKVWLFVGIGMLVLACFCGVLAALMGGSAGF